MTVPTSRATSANWTGLGPVPAEIQGWLDQAMLDFLPPEFTYMGFGLRRNIPANSGRTATFERPNPLTVSTSQIPEYETPNDSQQFSTSYVVATIGEYGTRVGFSRRATELGLVKNLLGKVRDVLTVNKKDTFDQLTRDALVAGTQLRRANGSARTDINTQISIDDINYSTRLLTRANARTITKRIEPSTGVGTRGGNPAFIAFGHTDLYPALAALNTSGVGPWQDVADYPAGTKRYDNEVGTIHGLRDVRVILTPNGKIFAGGGAAVASTGMNHTSDVIDVYALVIIAEGAYIETAINGKSQGVIVKELGSGGDTDPYNQRGSIAWCDYYTATIADDARMVRIESAVSAIAA